MLPKCFWEFIDDIRLFEKEQRGLWGEKQEKQADFGVQHNKKLGSPSLKITFAWMSKPAPQAALPPAWVGILIWISSEQSLSSSP